MTNKKEYLKQAIKTLNQIKEKETNKEIQLIRKVITYLHYELEIRVKND